MSGFDISPFPSAFRISRFEGVVTSRSPGVNSICGAECVHLSSSFRSVYPLPVFSCFVDDVCGGGVSGFEITCFPGSFGSQAARLFNRRWEKGPGKDHLCYLVER